MGPAIQSRLGEADLAAHSIDQLLPGHRAYNWAQKLCGVEFLEEQPPSSVSYGAPATSRAAVKPTFPSTAPIFSLSLTGLTPRPPDAAPRPPGSPRLQGDSQDASEWMRDFEMELNLNWVDQLPLGPGVPGLLVAQLHRLLAMMDVALEAAAETTENVFAKSQVYFAPIRGRMRKLPLQFCKETQVFQQR